MGKRVIGIIFISLFILFGSVVFITGIETPEGEGGDEGGGGPTCSDTDGGDYEEQGTCQDSINSYEDVCTNANTLREYDCTDSNYCGFELKTCDNGCVNGACVPGSCTDTDVTGPYPDGKNYGVKGTCDDASVFTPVDDSCNQSNTVNEWFCGDVDLCVIEYNIACVGDCVDGACLTEGGRRRTTSCTDDSECADVCDVSTGVCVECVSIADCDAGSGETCVGNVCAAPSSGSCESIYLYSNQSTLIFETTLVSSGSGILPITARPTTTSAAWTAVIPQARWIWGEATVSNPTENATVVFTKTFNLDNNWGVISGVLDVAADNSYSCELNGVVVGVDESERNFEITTQDKYTLVNDDFLVGENTLNCTVKNWEMPGAEAGDNPAGLLYGLSINSGDCATSCLEGVDGGLNYFVPGNTSVGAISHTDSCSADGSTLTEYSCTVGGAITSSEFPCVCIEGSDGGYCELSGGAGGMACEEFESHSVTGDLVDVTEMEGVVDDEIHIVHVVAIKLRNNGYEVVTAENGAVAYELACEDKPDIVITDCQMPVMTGLELIDKLRKNEATADIPVILLTARSFAIEQDVQDQLKISACLSKPFSPRELLENIEDILYDNAVTRKS